MRSVLIIVSCVLGVAAMAYDLAACKAKKEVKQVERVAEVAHDTDHYYRDLYGREHADKEIAQGDLRVIRALYGRRLDSVSRQLGVREKQISVLESALATAKGQFTTVLVRDSTSGPWRNGYQFRYSDSFTVITGDVDSSLAHVSCAYLVEVPIDLATYWRRKHKLLGVRFGRKVYRVDASSRNPSVHLSGLESIVVRKGK